MLGISILGASRDPRVARTRRGALRATLLCATASLAACGQPGPLYLPAPPAARLPAVATPSSTPGSAPAMSGKPAPGG